MSEFQAALLVIGALVVVGVIGYNKWQERQARRAADEAFRSRHADVLMENGESGARASPVAKHAIRVEPEFVPLPAQTVQRPAVEASEGGLPDTRIDYVVELVADSAVAIAVLHEHWAGASHQFAGRVNFSALLDGHWAAVPQGGRCEKLRAAFQLVSRAGVVTEAELLEFRTAIESLAAKLGVSVAAPEMREALEAARALDKVCAEADIQIAFHLVAAPGAAFSGTKLRAAAEASGLVLDADGRFSLRDDEGRELYCVTDRGGDRFSAVTMKETLPHALTLAMDVPRAPDTQRTFDAMVRFGRQLATLVGGTLVDDNGQALDERSVVAIDAQLNVVRRALEAHGMAPGSALALRVFS